MVELAGTITKVQSLVYSWKSAAHLNIAEEEQKHLRLVWAYAERTEQIASGMKDVRQELGQRASVLPMVFAGKTLALGIFIDLAYADIMAMVDAMRQSLVNVGNAESAWHWSDAQHAYEATPRATHVDWDTLRSGAPTEDVITALNGM
jgi:hypothetical protein